jgi:hypothetical protein
MSDFEPGMRTKADVSLGDRHLVRGVNLGDRHPIVHTINLFEAPVRQLLAEAAHRLIGR